MPHAPEAKSVLYDGKHVRLVKRGQWEYVERTKTCGIVGIVAITDDRKLIFVEQYRPPVGNVVIEIPAGLAGDMAGHENEPLADAARRELLEETGYEAAEMILLADGAASAGITDEIITLFRATGLKKTGDGAGDGSEQITVHEVLVDEAYAWVCQQRNAGKLIDLKVFGALYFASFHLLD